MTFVLHCTAVLVALHLVSSAELGPGTAVGQVSLVLVERVKPVTTQLGHLNAPTGCAIALFQFGMWYAVVTWNDNSPNETGFEVQWQSLHSSGMTTVAANTTSASVPVPQASGSTLRCRVRAFNASGHSAWSGWANVVVP